MGRNPKNVQFNYMYRDGANYKNFGYAIFENPDNLDLQEAEIRIRKCMSDGQNFIASQIDISEVFISLRWESSRLREIKVPVLAVFLLRIYPKKTDP